MSSFKIQEIFENVNMEVEAQKVTGTSSNISVNGKIEMASFNMSGLSTSNNILTIPSGYHYFLNVSMYGGNSSENYTAVMRWYNEDSSSYVGSRSYFANQNSTSGPSTYTRQHTRMTPRIMILDSEISTNMNLSVRLETDFLSLGFRTWNYIFYTIYRIPS